MGRAKDIILKPLKSEEAGDYVKKHHYSGKVCNNSQFHIGVYLGGKLGGVMQFGPSLDKSKIAGLVEGTKWNEFIELNRMAFSDLLPRNSESRAIAMAMKILKKHAPHIKWVVSFADGTQCGDGTIYRASGFVLTGIKKNTQVWEAPTGEKFSRMSLTDGRSKQEQEQARRVISRKSVTKEYHVLGTGGGASMKSYIAAGWKPKVGFQLRYIYFIDKSYRGKLTVPIIPFSEIERRGAKMYKGVRGDTGDTPGDQSGKGGSTPTRTLHNK